jgi:transcriptional regulator with XRE-family HTH domain
VRKGFLKWLGGGMNSLRLFKAQFEKTFSLKNRPPLERTAGRGNDGMSDGSDNATQPARRRPVTLRDVAETSGVSVATASKALNDQGRMTAETRTRIRAVALQLGFRPNSLAQSLLRRRSFTVGLLTNDSYGRFSLPVMAGVSEALLDNGVSVFLCNVEDDPRLGQLHVDAMLDKRVDGIIASGKRLDRHLPVDLSNLGIPVIYAFTEPDPNSIAFVSDDEGGASLAVEHFVALGRKTHRPCRRARDLRGRPPARRRLSRRACRERTDAATRADGPLVGRLGSPGRGQALRHTGRKAGCRFLRQ